MVLETPQLLLDGRGSGQTARDVTQNPRQRAQLRYGGLQEGIFTLELPCVCLYVCLYVCVCVCGWFEWKHQDAVVEVMVGERNQHGGNRESRPDRK